MILREPGNGSKPCEKRDKESAIELSINMFSCESEIV